MRIAIDNKMQKIKINPTKISITFITISTLACQISLPKLSTPQEEILPPTSLSPLITTAPPLPTPTPPPSLDSPNEVGEEVIIGAEIDLTPTPELTPTITPQAILIYVQPQSPVYLVNFLHPELGCKWSGVAGQIFNSMGEPVNGLIVEISGALNGNPFLRLGLSGMSIPIGPGGYEIQLSDKPFDSNNELSLRVFDQDGKQLNETLPLVTYNDCQKNLMIINFSLLNQPLREKTYFPIISR